MMIKVHTRVRNIHSCVYLGNLRVNVNIISHVYLLREENTEDKDILALMMAQWDIWLCWGCLTIRMMTQNQTRVISRQKHKMMDFLILSTKLCVIWSYYWVMCSMVLSPSYIQYGYESIMTSLCELDTHIIIIHLHGTP